ncbi:MULTISPECIES: hypothetical protein [unclassified Bradyrhizobium]|uniref:hypothetical protein n=1 Tax=unclassified Bradyrhizobium TaxID=2631580 RepID=UPI0029170BFA|nr:MULTISPECIES: hypothetical protein [unclassified Bradyrhizobium]
MKKIFWREQILRRDIDTLKRQLRERLGGYRVAINYPTRDNLLFRGVVCDERPHTIDRISYPPADKVTKLGRLNRIGQPMFYSSRAAPAVYYEIHARPGQCIAVSTWEFIEPLWMHNLGYHADSVRRIGGAIDGQRGRLTNPIANETKFNAQLRRQLSEAFTEDVEEGQEERYKLPIAINELLFDDAGPLPTDVPDGPRCDEAAATVYPAMRMRGFADNIAIWPKFADRWLRLRAVSYVLVEAADATRSAYTISSIDMSEDVSGRELIWKGGVTDERRRRGHISFENGRWVQRDGLNEVYAVH